MTTKIENESNLVKHADRELKLAGLHEKDSDYEGELYNAVMELVRLFCKQGHSGFSANRTISLFSKVALFQNLLPLFGNYDEWNKIEEDNTCFQNNRVFSVFKNKDTNKSYYLDSIVWRDQDGATFTGCVEKVSSRQYVKSFPFYPKTFYIDVLEQENGEYKIKDRKQLKEVFDYYEEFKEI